MVRRGRSNRAAIGSYLNSPVVSARAQFAKHFGVQAPSKTPTGTRGILDQMVSAWFRYHSRHQSEWEVIDREYHLGRDVRGQNFLETDEVSPSRVYSNVHATEAMVLGNRPKFFLRGWRPDLDDVRGVMEETLNSEWKQNFALWSEVKLAVRDCSKKGFGVILNCYEGDYDPEEQDRVSRERRRAREESPELIAAEAELAALSPEDPEEARETFEGDSRVRRGKVVSRRISPWSFMYDPESSGPEDAQWMGRIIVTDMRYVQDSMELQHKDSIKVLSPDDLQNRFRNRENLYQVLDSDDFPSEPVVLYEIFYRQPGGTWDLYVISESSDKVHRHVKDAYWIGCPYSILRWNEDGDTFNPMSDAQVILSEAVAERIVLTKFLRGVVREQADVSLIDEGLVSDEDLNNVVNAGDNVVVKVKNKTNSTLQQGVATLPRETKAGDAPILLSLLERSIGLASGQGPNQMGQALKSETSATEAANVDTFARGRSAHKLGAVEKFLSDIAYRTLGLKAQHYTASDIQRMHGPEAAEAWGQAAFVRDDFDDLLRVNIEPGSSEPDSDAMRRRELFGAIQAVQTDQTGVLAQMLDVPALWQEYLEMIGFKNGSKYIRMSADDFAALTEQAALQGQAGSGSPPSPQGGTPLQVLQG